MSPTGASSARQHERGQDAAWLAATAGLPDPSKGPRRWLVFDPDRAAESRHQRPKPLGKELPEVWSLTSPPRSSVVVTARGGVASSSLGHSRRPLSASPRQWAHSAQATSLGPRMSLGTHSFLAALGNAPPTFSARPGCWTSLALGHDRKRFL